MTGFALPQLSDPDLVAAAKSGNRQAFGELVIRYRPDVVAVIDRMVGDTGLAEDTAQEAFIRAWQRLHLYNPQYPFKNWLLGIATHLVIDLLRRDRQTTTLDDQIPGAVADQTEVSVESRERCRQVRQAVLELPAASRAVLILREYEGLSYQEISSVLNIPIGTVMSRLSYARGLLRKTLAPYLEMP